MIIEDPKRPALARWAVLSWAASFCSVTGKDDYAEGYCLELVSTAGSGWSWRA